MHCAFSTKQRFPSIEPELESRLWPYKWEKPLPIFKSRKSIIAGKPFKRSSRNYSSDTASNTIADTSSLMNSNSCRTSE